MSKKAIPRDLRVIDHWKKAAQKWSTLMPPLVSRLDGSRYLAQELPRSDEEFRKAGYQPMRTWKRGPNTIDRPIPEWPKTEQEFLADGWVPATGWRHEAFPLSIAAHELADASLDLASLAKREGISASPALRLARSLRSLTIVQQLDLRCEVDLLVEEILLDKNAKPTARALDDIERSIVAALREARGHLVKSGDLYARSLAAHRMEKDAFRKRMRRLCEDGWTERVGHFYRSGRKAGRPDPS